MNLLFDYPFFSIHRLPSFSILTTFSKLILNVLSILSERKTSWRIRIKIQMYFPDALNEFSYTEFLQLC